MGTQQDQLIQCYRIANNHVCCCVNIEWFRYCEFEFEPVDLAVSSYSLFVDLLFHMEPIAHGEARQWITWSRLFTAYRKCFRFS